MEKVYVHEYKIIYAKQTSITRKKIQHKKIGAYKTFKQLIMSGSPLISATRAVQYGKTNRTEPNRTKIDHMVRFGTVRFYHIFYCYQSLLLKDKTHKLREIRPNNKKKT